MTETLPTLFTAPPAVHAAALASAIPLFEDRFRLLSPAEIRLMEALSTEGRRHTFFGGRVLAKQCVASLLKMGEVSFVEIDISRGTGGAPVVRGGEAARAGVRVAISHGGEYLFAGAACDAAVGVDVEPIGTRAYQQRERFMDPDEIAAANRFVAGGASSEACYTAIFSAKESLAKWDGTHMYHAFYYYRFVAFEDDMLYFDSRSRAECRGVHRRLFDGHVFTWLVSAPQGDLDFGSASAMEKI